MYVYVYVYIYIHVYIYIYIHIHIHTYIHIYIYYIYIPPNPAAFPPPPLVQDALGLFKQFVAPTLGHKDELDLYQPSLDVSIGTQIAAMQGSVAKNEAHAAALRTKLQPLHDAVSLVTDELGRGDGAAPVLAAARVALDAWSDAVRSLCIEKMRGEKLELVQLQLESLPGVSFQGDLVLELGKLVVVDAANTLGTIAVAPTVRREVRLALNRAADTFCAGKLPIYIYIYINICMWAVF